MSEITMRIKVGQIYKDNSYARYMKILRVGKLKCRVITCNPDGSKPRHKVRETSISTPRIRTCNFKLHKE